MSALETKSDEWARRHEGGVSIEAWLAYKDLDLDIIAKVAEVLTARGFRPRVDNLGSAHDKAGIPNELPAGIALDRVSKWAASSNYSALTINFLGRLDNVDAIISVYADSPRRVLCVAISENVLWNYGPHKRGASILPLKAFASIVREICKIMPPLRTHVGLEDLSPEEASSQASSNEMTESYDSKVFLSDEDIHSFFGEYLEKTKHFG